MDSKQLLSELVALRDNYVSKYGDDCACDPGMPGHGPTMCGLCCAEAAISGDIGGCRSTDEATLEALRVLLLDTESMSTGGALPAWHSAGVAVAVAAKHGLVYDLAGLAAHLGANDKTMESIARRLYKDTSSGISFWSDGASVSLSGYCEGVDFMHQPHRFNFPFFAEDFDCAVELADEESSDVWDETHGCEDCGPEGDTGYIAINPDCKSCGGEGVVI